MATIKAIQATSRVINKWGLQSTLEGVMHHMEVVADDLEFESKLKHRAEIYDRALKHLQQARKIIRQNNLT